MYKYLIIISIFFLTSCKKKESEKEILNKELSIPENISEFSKPQIAKIYESICVDNWNTGNHLSRRSKDYYNNIARKYNINVQKIELIESFYNNEVIPFLTKKVKYYFAENKNLELDYYSPIYPTAYCGLNTIKGKLIVFGDEINSVENSKKIAESLSKNLPDFASGYKLNQVIFKDTILGIEKELEIAFLFRKNDSIKIMKKSIGTYGFEESKMNTKWHTDEWNNEKEATVKN
jgi:hypothetical protein